MAVPAEHEQMKPPGALLWWCTTQTPVMAAARASLAAGGAQLCALWEGSSLPPPAPTPPSALSLESYTSSQPTQRTTVSIWNSSAGPRQLLSV